MSEKQLHNVKHDYIRYANCWEDADILLEGLDIIPGDRVLSIGSAGDNSFSLLTQSPELVVAVDINPVQLKLIELKKAAFRTLEYEEFIAFLGFTETSERLALYSKVREALSDEACTFWDQRKTELESGIIHAGKFERYFQRFRTKILPLVHTRKRVNGLFAEKTAAEQKQFFDTKWNRLRWRLLFRIFFSKFVMGRLGRDPAFLKEVEVPVSEFILEQARKHLAGTQAQCNYFLHYIMKGQFAPGLPHYARKEHFETIRANLDRLHIFEGLAEDAFREYDSFTKFNLSNIFEYMNRELFTEVVRSLVDHGTTGARYAYWNLMVPRKMHEVNEEISYEAELSAKLHSEDKGFFYGGFHINVKV